MKQYSFMEREAIRKIDIPKHISKKYGIEINAMSLEKNDFIYKKAEEVLEKALSRKYIDELYKIGSGNSEEIEEVKHLKDIISDIIEMISEMDFFIPDLKADCFMGLICSDEEYDVMPDDKMEQGWGPTNEADKKRFRKSDNFERIRNAQRHYPYAKNGDENFPLDGIPGGCREYHKLMMNQKNISIFDISIDRKNMNTDIKKYGFQKAHDIYQELKNTPVENLLLLEKTLGIGYTNQLFYYAQDFTKKSQLNQLEGVISSCAEIPMFVRKYITDKIWSYLKKFSYSDLSIKYAEEAVDLIVCLINEAYEEVLELYWYAYYLAWSNCCLESNILLELENYWKRYYEEETAYRSMIKSENIHDWRGIKRVEDCFYGWKNKYRMDGVYLATDKIVFATIIMDDHIVYDLAVQSPKNELGEEILRMTVEEFNEEIRFHDKIQACIRANIELERKIRNYEVSQEEKVMDQNLQELYGKLDDNNKGMLDLYYEIRDKKFEELKKKENAIWSGKEIKVGKQGLKLKPLHIYALIHADIVRLLNE